MPTLLEGIADKYEHHDEDDYGGFIVFMSSSPDVKKGMFPRVMSLCDYSLQHVGTNGLSLSRLTHITELDLTENAFSKWSEMLRILDIFPNLVFLNMSKNNFSEKLELTEAEQAARRALPLRKLVLNSNRIDWASLNALTRAMPVLEELHLSNNALVNPEWTDFAHPNLRILFLTCNPGIDSFASVQMNLGTNCPNLETLSLSECPIADVPVIDRSLPPESVGLGKLVALNVNATRIAKWEDVDNFRTFPSLQELRIRGCPLMEEYTAHERRSLLVARLPNVAVFNGGDKVPGNEREDAERAFIRFYLDEAVKPARFDELVAVHGQLEPLVNISMKPETRVKVTIADGRQPVTEEVVREEVISVYQTIAQFKAQLHQWFQIPVQNIKLYYCDQVLVKAAGPEEMKWPNKALYTYNVREGDSFIVDEKAPLPKLKTPNKAAASGGGATSPKVYGQSPVFPSVRNAVTFAAINPKTFLQQNGGSGSSSSSSSKPPTRSQTAAAAAASAASQPRSCSTASDVARNLFGDGDDDQTGSGGGGGSEANNNTVKNREEGSSNQPNHSAGS